LAKIVFRIKLSEEFGRKTIGSVVMSVTIKPLVELVQELPPDVQAEVRDFVEFLLTKHSRKFGKKLRQDWAGALRDYRDQYTSLDLQRQALDWRGD
jgi:hypothetical protein